MWKRFADSTHNIVLFSFFFLTLYESFFRRHSHRCCFFFCSAMGVCMRSDSGALSYFELIFYARFERYAIEMFEIIEFWCRWINGSECFRSNRMAYNEKLKEIEQMHRQFLFSFRIRRYFFFHFVFDSHTQTLSVSMLHCRCCRCSQQHSRKCVWLTLILRVSA